VTGRTTQPPRGMSSGVDRAPGTDAAKDLGRPRVTPGTSGIQVRTRQAERARATEAQPPCRTLDAPNAHVAVVLGPRSRESSVRGLLGFAHAIAADARTAVVAISNGERSVLEGAGADRWIPWPESISLARDPDHAVQFLLQVEAHLAPRCWVFPNETPFADLAFRFAAAIGEAPAADVIRADNGQVVRLAPSGRIEFYMPAARVITADESAGQRITQFLCEAKVLPIELPAAAAPRYEVTELPVDAASIEIEEASLIVSGGAGVRDWDNLRKLAQRLGGAVGATRSACDAGRVARDRQVGSSGQQARADYYLALGISGAPQHLQGIENCARVSAVNLDPFAPIFKRADFGAVGDADAVVAALLDLLATEHAQ
jgi:electron transfer flavoprotein alpha subunit